MKRNAILLAAVVIFGGLIQGSPAQAGKAVDALQGSGKTGSGDHANLLAKSTGSGLDARGQAHIRYSFAEENGTVDCLNVQGNRAVASGLYDNPVPRDGKPPLSRFFVLVEDNGNPSEEISDRLAVGGSVSANRPSDCGFFLFSLLTLEVAQGNLSVSNAS